AGIRDFHVTGVQTCALPISFRLRLIAARMANPMKILVTGAAGFVGFHTTKRLLGAGHEVVGIDNLNAYYDVGLKQGRLALLKDRAEERRGGREDRRQCVSVR